MTKLYNLFWIALFIVSALTACVNYNDASTSVALSVKLSAPSNFKTDADLSGMQVTLTQSNRTYTATTNEQGVATFRDVIPDVYDVTTSWKLSPTRYFALTGDVVQSSYTLSGNSISRLVNGVRDTLILPVNVSENQSLIIGKVYASGSKDRNNANYIAGTYIEFFNNSEDTIDIAGMYYGILESGSTPAYTLGITPNYLYLKQAYRFPTNSPTIVLPGGTIIVANSAIDHTQNYAPLEHNLLDANFEAKDASGRAVNNPTTPAIELVYTSAPSVTQMNLTRGGPTSVVLFTATASEVATWVRSYAYGRTSGTQYLRLPIEKVKDGVDILKYSTTAINTANKRLYDNIDAGYTTISSATGWNGDVLYRQTDSIAPNGRRILKDTNNSTNDFKVSNTIAPRQYD